MSSGDTPMQLPSLEALRGLCEAAGRDILAFRSIGHDVQYKRDGSPVSEADYAAHRRLAAGLPQLVDLPVLSEEQATVPWTVRREWQCYWLVDPLDGTRDYVDGYDDFTVNVALVTDGHVLLGMVHAPATGLTWAGGSGLGAWRWCEDFREPLRVRVGNPLRIVASRAHIDDATQRLVSMFPDARLQRYGSSVKFCRIAEGGADLYPRVGPTCEWDTAAGQGVLEGAGGAVLSLESGLTLRYNHAESLINSPFVACSDATLVAHLLP
ncbi:3'(2'),5'-bisphosphate nucleotidase CysQ [Halomonas chromatireducens]|uniref:3'(2'),5'-bisphosphate nucleotidase CysQ n=1 Tax=Halomonas chromatireducens TaxID=507626 RepID=A0A0X8HBC8_9GAMM|nr:3'(2'),5'-bisphosphate nucleotidase CysQ [Halomonas chromatireducens]AMC99517.1 3'(2'),5'-bisphosphate nucleotidase CysQ [Halomonas chromatireducens]